MKERNSGALELWVVVLSFGALHVPRPGFQDTAGVISQPSSRNIFSSWSLEAYEHVTVYSHDIHRFYQTVLSSIL